MGKQNRNRAGFTLAEVLIALALLGVVAAFAIPKVLQSQADQQRNTKIKEVVSIFYAVMEEGRLNNTLSPENEIAFFQSQMNTRKNCMDSAAEGCWDPNDNPNNSLDDRNNAGFVLQNGVFVTGLSNCCNLGNGQYSDGILIDWNGNEGTSVLGDDVFAIHICYGTSLCTHSTITNNGAAEPMKVGQVRAAAGVPGEQTLKEIMASSR